MLIRSRYYRGVRSLTCRLPLVVQGTADESLPVPVTEQFVAAYERAGVIIELKMFTGIAHWFVSNPGP